MASQIFKSHLVLIPNIEAAELTIGDLCFRHGGIWWLDECSDPEEKQLVSATIRMVQNEGLSSKGVFLYCFADLTGWTSNEISLDMRKAIALLRFAAFEEKPGLNVEDVGFFVFRVLKSDDEAAETRYFLLDALTGHGFFAPGFPNETRSANYPHLLFDVHDHYLIKKHNEHRLDDRYLSSIEWFNRTFEKSSDNTEDIIKLAVAFEKIHPLAGDKAKDFSTWIYEKFGSELAKRWANEFYKTRGVILHGNEFADYPRDTEQAHNGELKRSTYWMHPQGYTDYTTHASIGREIFKFLLREEILGPQVKDGSVAATLTNEFIDDLLVPNEIRYNRLQQLVNTDIQFGDKHFEIISKLRGSDFTGDKSTVYSLLDYYLERVDELLPELNEETRRIRVLKQEDNRRVNPALSQLSKQIQFYYIEDGKTLVPHVTKLHYLSRFFEITSICLSQIFWRETLEEAR